MATFGAPNFLSVIDAYESGSRQRERNRLAELDARGRELTGAALSGNKNALAELGGVNPEAYMNVAKFTQEQKKQQLGEFLSAAYSASTPEAWNGVVQRFKAQGHQFGPGEDAFENRANLIRQGISVADQMGMDLQGQKYAADTARDERNFAATQDYRNRSLAIQQQMADARSGGGVPPSGYRRTADGNLEAITGGPADPKVKAAQKAGPMTASMLKLKRETENSLIDIGNTRENLKAALALVGTEQRPGDVMSGFAPETRAFIGNSLPDWTVPDQIASPKSAAATKNYTNVMNLESIQRMANTLKGATTDFELNEFVKILSDPTAPNAIKRQTIQRMMKLSDAQEGLERQRLEEFGGQMPDQNAPNDQQGGDTQQDNADFFIQQANDAIAAGADPEAVRQRLRDMGVDSEFGQ